MASPRGEPASPSLATQTFLTLPPIQSSSFAGAAIVIPNDHFLRPKPPPEMPWEMDFARRKALSKDPRMMKHTKDEAQWLGTAVEGTWKDIRKFAPALQDWYMTPEQLNALLQHWGIQSQYLLAKLWELLDTKATGKCNALVLCKYMEIVIADPRYRPLLLRHCFDLFDRRAGDDIDVELVQTVQLANPADAAAAGKKKKKAGGAPTTMKAGANYNHVQALLLLLPRISRKTPDFVAYDDFCAALMPAMDHENAFFWAAMAAQVVEIFCGRCGPPHGTPPQLSMRWLATTLPVAPGESLHDADVVLLRELEAAGGENAKKDKKGKKRSASPPAAAKA